MWYLIFLLSIGSTLGQHQRKSLPKGARGTIDFRYPDYIVDPLPPCPEVGTFPHPRNCTWYYRCYSHVILGQTFYRRSYFECEPGTAFSDELDQCIFPSGTGECPDTPVPPAPLPCQDIFKECEEYDVCYDGQLAQRKKLCRGAVTSCPSSGRVSPKCSPTQFYDLQSRKCVPDPANSKCSVQNTCEKREGDCRTAVICDQNGFRKVQFLCKNTYLCDSNNNLVAACPNSHFYDRITHSCVEPNACNKDQLTAGCEYFDVCDSPGSKRREYLCRYAYKYSSDNSLSDLCPPNLFYHPSEDRCVKNPDTRQCPKCVPNVGTCETHEVCVNNVPENRLFCKNQQYCTQFDVLMPRCPANEFYDTKVGTCHATPDIFKCPVCEESYIECKYYNVCYTPGNRQRTKLCRQAFTCVNNQPEAYCSTEMFYDLFSGNCVAHPDTLQC